VETQASIKAGGEGLARSDGFEWLARAGFAARGIVYVITGILAVKLALGRRRHERQPAGCVASDRRAVVREVLLILVAIGLGGYVLWRPVRALLGHGPKGSDSGVDRVAAFASGVVCAGFCAIAVEILLGSGGGSGGAQKTTAGVFGWPAGTWLVWLALTPSW